MADEGFKITGGQSTSVTQSGSVTLVRRADEKDNKTTQGDPTEISAVKVGLGAADTFVLAKPVIAKVAGKSIAGKLAARANPVVGAVASVGCLGYDYYQARKLEEGSAEKEKAMNQCKWKFAILGIGLVAGILFAPVGASLFAAACIGVAIAGFANMGADFLGGYPDGIKIKA